MKKVLLLGGTGAIGVYLKNELLSLGFDVVITTRKPHPGASRVTYVCGDAHDESFLRQTLRAVSPDAVVDFMSYGTEEFRARADFLLSSTSHYVFLSSYRVFNDANPVVESSPRLLDSIDDPDYLNTDEYALCKARSEDILRASGKTNWTIVRPSITYSKMRFQFGCLEADVVCYRALRGRPVVIPPEMLSKPTTMTWGGDVAKMIARLVLNDKAYGEDYNVVTAEHHTWREVAEIYQEHIGLDVMEIPLARYCQICNPKQVMYDRMFTRIMDNSKVLAATGLAQTDLKCLRDGLGYELDVNRRDIEGITPNVTLNAMMDAICGDVNIPTEDIRSCITYLRARFSLVRFVIGIMLIPKRILWRICK